MKPRTTAKRLFLSSATTMPNGSDPMSVRAKIPQVRSMPTDIVESMVCSVIVAPRRGVPAGQGYLPSVRYSAISG